MDTKFITPADKKDFQDFFAHHLTNLIAERFRERGSSDIPPLYYYTTGQTLINIIESGAIWSTQAACLNDAKELLHAIELLLDGVKNKLMSCGQDHVARLLFETMRSILEKPQVELAGSFVICFSERADDLSQWRAYGHLGT